MYGQENDRLVLTVKYSQSSPVHYSSLLDIDLSNFSPSRSIFGYLHPAPASRSAPPPGLRASYTTFTETLSPLQNSFTLAVVGCTADTTSPLLLQRAMSVTLVFCRIASLWIRSRRETSSIVQHGFSILSLLYGEMIKLKYQLGKFDSFAQQYVLHSLRDFGTTIST
jgi:hypothetical protein